MQAEQLIYKNKLQLNHYFTPIPIEPIEESLDQSYHFSQGPGPTLQIPVLGPILLVPTGARDCSCSSKC